jgi:hypothetical protein
MTDLIHLSNEIQLKQEIEKLKEVNRQLKEQLEYFTDKYGLPDSFEDIKPLLKSEIKEESGENLISLNSKSVQEIHQALIAQSVKELLKIQLSELLELISIQNQQNVHAFNSILALKEKLRLTDK